MHEQDVYTKSALSFIVAWLLFTISQIIVNWSNDFFNWFSNFYFAQLSSFESKLALNCIFFLGRVKLKNKGQKGKKTSEIDGSFEICLKSLFSFPIFFGSFFFLLLPHFFIILLN